MKSFINKCANLVSILHSIEQRNQILRFPSFIKSFKDPKIVIIFKDLEIYIPVLIKNSMHKKNNTSLLNITTRLEVCFLENNYIIEIRAFIGLHKTEERKKNSTCSRKYKMNDL